MFEKAQWIWNTRAEGTDSYVEFITGYEFDKNDSVKLRISADSNYAVYINGKFVDSGQYADQPDYKVYDEIELDDFIVPGVNHIAFVVWYYGLSSFNYFVGNHGLLFEVEQNGEIVLSSDEVVKSRKSRLYISGKNEMITTQLGLNFHIDLKNRSSWMTGDDKEGFESSIIVNEMPRKLFPREIKKLVVKPRVSTEVIGQGTFAYLAEGEDYGAKMQHAALTFFRPWEMGQENLEEKPVTIVGKTEDGIYFMIDLKSEYAGYLDFDLEVHEDCQMEIGWGEHLEDGRCRTSIGNRNFSVTVGLKKGRNSYMNPFRRLGCRYIQFFVHTDTVKVYYAGIRPTEYPLKKKAYKSGNLLRNKIYAVSQHTLIQCMHEHYEDCPWREQALYTLDSRNQMLCGYFAFDEYEFPRANLRLISRSVREDGALPICFPTRDSHSIPFFTLAYIMQLAEYYRYSKDAETVKYCFDCVEKIVDSFVGRIDETGLIPNFDEADSFWNFYEWQTGLNGWTYEGKNYDMCLNAMFSLTIDYFAELCSVIEVDMQPYLWKKRELNKRIAETFYDEKSRLFRTCIGKEIPCSVLANALGYLCGAAKELDDSRILNIIQYNRTDNPNLEVIPATLSMYVFRYDALLRDNIERYKAFILDEIDRTYLEMLGKSATSFWETIKGDRDFCFAGSLCHGWSAMPIYYYDLLCSDC